MANEITAQTFIGYQKNGIVFNRSPQKQIDVSGDKLHHTVVALTTAHEALPVGDVDVVGVSFGFNLSEDTGVQIGRVVSATFYPVITLLPGEAWPFRASTDQLYARAVEIDSNSSGEADLEWFVADE